MHPYPLYTLFGDSGILCLQTATWKARLMFLRSINEQYDFNLFQNQCYDSYNCGFYCIFFCVMLENGMSFDNFKTLFSKNCRKNDMQIVDLLTHALKKMWRLLYRIYFIFLFHSFLQCVQYFLSTFIENRIWLFVIWTFIRHFLSSGFGRK